MLLDTPVCQVKMSAGLFDLSFFSSGHMCSLCNGSVPSASLRATALDQILKSSLSLFPSAWFYAHFQSVAEEKKLDLGGKERIYLNVSGILLTDLFRIILICLISPWCHYNLMHIGVWKSRTAITF